MNYDVIVNFDGGCWPNPGGKATWGFVARVTKTNFKTKGSGKIDEGETSNNVAECVAASKALLYIDKSCKPGETVLLCGDSRVVLSKIASTRIGKGLFFEALEVAKFLYSQAVGKGIKVDLKWVPRNENQEADDLT